MNDILVLDNYDSFTFNLVHLLEEVTGKRPHVIRNDQISVEEADRFESIVLSPGPGLPSEAGIMPKLVAKFLATKKILGVCLGHQCIAESCGATLLNLSPVSHGQDVATNIVDVADPLFKEIPHTFQSGRYHSWSVDPATIPSSLKVTALDEAGRIMAIRHVGYRVWGVQFHPESVMTPCGAQMLKNWSELA